MKQYGLGKSHKLCSQTAIDRLFSQANGCRSALAYPLRAVWSTDSVRRRATDEPLKFMISVPKKRVRKAVDRVLTRRRIREAYRLRRPAIMPDDQPATDIVFVYVAQGTEPYDRIDNAIKRLLKKIAASALSGTADAESVDSAKTNTVDASTGNK